jgi:septal ring factor EnvC (AmiA/AmiB activator)
MSGEPVTGRRRCGIPEHRKQIKSMQKWVAFVQTQIGLQWAQRQLFNRELDDVRRQMWRYKHALTAIATSPKVWTRDQMIDCAVDALAEQKADGR